MKRYLLIAGVALFLLALAAPQAMAAPSVALKCGAGAGIVGLEAGFPLGDNWAIVAEGGWLPDGFIAMLGARYYFVPEGWRFFVALYGGATYVNTVEATGFVPVGIGTAGVSKVWDSGFYLSAEAGLELVFILPIPAFGLALGYQF